MKAPMFCMRVNGGGGGGGWILEWSGVECSAVEMNSETVPEGRE